MQVETKLWRLQTAITLNMDSNHHHTGLRDSPSHLPASHVKYHLPYFTPEEVERFSERQRGKLSVAQEEKQRQQACGFIEAVGSKIGLSVRLLLTG